MVTVTEAPKGFTETVTAAGVHMSRPAATKALRISVDGAEQKGEAVGLGGPELCKQCTPAAAVSRGQ